MLVTPYYLGCLSHASYLIADERTKVAAVVDPQRDVDHYLRDAEAGGYSIQHVFLTHFHADFLAGHIELRDQVGARIYLGRRAEAEFEVTKVKDGDRIEFGDVGRPDLLASVGVTADELADMLYDSLTTKLVTLPDETLVYPAHGAGSMCGKNLSTETVSTIGEQKKFNYALQPMSRAEFKRIVTAEQPEAPSYFVHDAIRNRQERPNLAESLSASLKALPLESVLQLKDTGAQLLDVRDAIDFEGAHLGGAVNVGIKGKYATWCGSVLDHRRPIVVIADAGQQEEAVIRLGRIGFDNVAGYLDGGMDALHDRPDLVSTVGRITAVALSDRLATDAAPIVVDVRGETEWAAGHIRGSLNIPLNHLRDRVSEIATDRPVVLHCEGGYRSAIAASILGQAGRPDVLDMVGGCNAWVASGLPVDSVPTAGT